MTSGSGEERDGLDDRVRRAAQYRVDREIAREREEAGGAGPPDVVVGDGDDDAAGGGSRSGQAPRIGAMGSVERARYVDTVVDQAIRRGEFDDLPLAGKPIPGLRGTHDPDWWLKNLVERERITGMLPAAQLRQDAAGLDARLDQEAMESRVREIVAEFNARVIDARRQLTGGPPVVTPTRDADEEVRRWRARQEERRAEAARGVQEQAGGQRARRSSPGRATPRDGRRGKPWWRPW